MTKKKLKNKVEQYQGTNNAWFIKLNGVIICGSRDKLWSDKFLKLVQDEGN